MSTINLTDREIEAIGGINPDALNAAIENAIETESQSGLDRLVPFECGPFIQQKVRSFKVALQDYQKARSAKKREETRQFVTRRGWNLSSAVSQMQFRVKEEMSQRELFYVEDQFPLPLGIQDQMSVLISFRWRRSADDEWLFGNISFFYFAKASSENINSVGRRNGLSAKQRQQRERELYATWEHLQSSALCSVRDFFVKGGDGNAVPAKFTVVPDSYSGGLNNYSTQFWRPPT